MKKTLCIFIVCILAFSVLTTGVSAEETTMPEYIKYTISDGKVRITRCTCHFTIHRTVVIPETVDGYPVTSIAPGAFDSCVYHDTIQLPSTIEEIGRRGLDGNFKKIVVDENNKYFSSDDYGVLYNKDKTEILQYPTGRSETSYTVPDGVETIGAAAFYDSNLIEIVFPDSVKTIGEAAFHHSTSLKVANIPDSVETIESYAFAECYSLEEIHLGAGVRTIVYSALESPLKKVNVSADNPYYCNDENGVVYTKDMKEIVYYPEGKTDEKFVVPEGVVSFGTLKIFSRYLKEIVLSSTVEKVEQAFWECEVLERISVVENSMFFSNDEYGVLYNKDKTELVRCPRAITQVTYIVPDNVEKLGKYAFYYCSGLESIYLSPKITRISPFALNNCKSLKSLYLPSGVRIFSEQTFLGTVNVTDIYYFGTAEQWNSIIGKDWMQNNILETATVHYNYGLTSGACGENVTWSYNQNNGHLILSGIGEITEQESFDDYGWYSFSDEITYVEMGSGITNVPAFAFDGCTKLKEIYLSETVSSIGESAFNGCDKLKVISSTNENSISLSENSIPDNENLSIVCKKRKRFSCVFCRE